MMTEEAVPAIEERAIKNTIEGLTSGIDEVAIIKQLQNPRAAHQFTEVEALSIVDRAKTRMAKAVPAVPEVTGITPTMPESYVQARKRPDGKWQLFFTGTRNEVFPNELFSSSSEAKMAFRVAKARLTEAKPPAVEKVKLGGGNPMKTESERKSFHERIFGKGSTPPLERLGRGETLNNLLPMSPEEGPPLPRLLALRWPWKK